AKASTFFWQVVGVNFATPPPQMPLKSGRVGFWAWLAPGTIVHTAAARAATPSFAAIWVIRTSISPVRCLLPPSIARNFAVRILRKPDLDELAVGEDERVGEAEIGPAAVRVDVNLVGVADGEQPAVAQAETAEAVRSHGFGRPLLHRAVRLLHLEMKPGVRILP